MIDQSTYNLLLSEYNVSMETLNKISVDNISLESPGFSVLDCVTQGIPYDDTLGLIQYVYGTNLYSANEMYQVMVDKLKPVNITWEDEDLKKKTVATKTKTL